ncbi:MAG: hypothetical protein DHS20C15_10770 [Planctomycetota bacterium]|nr:MAG: hypothetical protein DHS20C15_10770 [Planctomycetota bacterium]
MSWDRRDRQEAILREKIATIVLERLNDPRLGFITITKAELSKDKRIVRVSYTVLGDDAAKRTTARALETAAPRIQELLAPTLKMRSLPEIRFVYATSVQVESRMLTLLEGLQQERGDDEVSPADEGAGNDDTAPAHDGSTLAEADDGPEPSADTDPDDPKPQP